VRDCDGRRYRRLPPNDGGSTEEQAHSGHGYQDYYEPLYWAAYHNIFKQGILGDVYAIEAARHSYNSGRVESEPDAVSFDPRPWGYASMEQLLNWRLYRQYSGRFDG